MALFGNKSQRFGGVMDVIRCDEPSYLIWKWHPAGSQTGNNKRENAIRWGSSLRVKDGEVAVFVYNQKDGPMQDFIVGPFDQILKTANLPILSSIIGLAYDGGTPFQAEVYFINLSRIIQVKFGVPFFDVYDPRFMDFGVPVAVRGTISFRIEDYREFIKLHRLNSFNLESFQIQIRDAVSRYVKDAVANAPAANDIPLVQIETKIAQVNDGIEYDISERLNETFGVVVSGVDIRAIELDKSSEGYRQLMAITKEVTAKRVEAETLDYTERLRIQREESQYAQHKQTQAANIGAYQIEKQTEVGVAGAQALGQMSANGGGSVNLSGDGAGFNPAAMMAGIALGGTVGQNIAGTMSGIMSGAAMSKSVTTPPPVPTSAYYIAVDGKATGPYDMTALAQMATIGTFTQESLVWKRGITDWVTAKSVLELQEVFSTVPPVPPTD